MVISRTRSLATVMVGHACVYRYLGRRIFDDDYKTRQRYTDGIAWPVVQRSLSAVCAPKTANKEKEKNQLTNVT